MLTSYRPRRGPTARATAALLVLGLLAACSRPDAELAALRDAGHVRVGTLPIAGTFTRDDAGNFGLSVTLVRAWARSLDLGVEFHPYPSREALFDAVANGEVHLAAATLAVDPAARDRVRFTSIYLHEPVLAVYRRGNPRPRTHEALAERTVVHASGIVPTPNGAVVARADRALHAVDTGSADVAIVQRRHLEAARLARPYLREAFDTGRRVPLAWAFPRGQQGALYEHAERWLRRARRDGTIARLREDAEGHRPDFDHVAMLFWRRHRNERLPEFEALFREAQDRTGLDWRLLASVAYQESHWQPDAVSPTGVRGLMMLTRATAREMGVERRTDPAQSIDGGARYLARLIARQSDDRSGADQLWLALAAYNVGHGHVLDARALTRAHGFDPDRWADVRRHLPMLEDPRYHETTRYGHARGREPVRYVGNIRRYYDALRLALPSADGASGDTETATVPPPAPESS